MTGERHEGRRRRRRWALVGSIVLAVLVVAGFTSTASAQSPSILEIRKADSVDPKNVKLDFFYTGNADDVKNAKISQVGADVKITSPAAPLQTTKGVVIVVDTGGGMDKDGGLNNLREGLADMVEAAPAGTEFAVVTAGDTGERRLDWTTDKQTVIESVNGPTGVNDLGASPQKGTAMWKALRIAGDMLTDRPTLQPNILMAVADNDNVSPKDEPAARTAVTGAGASVMAVERLGQMDPQPYNTLVAQTGGIVTSTGEANKVGDLAKAAGDVIFNKQYQIAYDSGLNAQAISEVTLQVGDLTSTASFLLGGVYQGSSALRPNVVSRSAGADLFSNKGVFVAALLLAAVGAGLFAYGLTSLFVKDELSNVLQPYADPYGTEDPEQSAIAKSALIARAVELTEQVAENQGLLTRAEGALERANLPLRAGEALFAYAVIVVIVTVLGLAWTRNMVGGIIFGVLGAMIPVAVVNFKAKKRRKQFMSQLPDTLQLLSGTLRAGYSLMQGVEAVSQEVDDPMGLELRRVVTEARLGRPLEESLDASAERMDSADFGWAVMAIRIQREVGGNLSELLMTVADTMVQRERLRRDVAALTAEGRVSAIVLACLPPALGVIMYVLNPDYTGTLFSEGLGIGMLITAGISMLIGFLWMRKIINIEI